MASSLLHPSIPASPDPLASITPLNARLLPAWGGSMRAATIPTGAPTSFSSQFHVGSSLASSLALGASSPTSLSSGYIPYMAPTEVLRSVRSLQELLFRSFQARFALPVWASIYWNSWTRSSSYWDVPNLLWIDVVLSRFIPAFASVYRHLARAGFVRFLVCSSTQPSWVPTRFANGYGTVPMFPSCCIKRKDKTNKANRKLNWRVKMSWRRQSSANESKRLRRTNNQETAR